MNPFKIIAGILICIGIYNIILYLNNDYSTAWNCMTYAQFYVPIDLRPYECVTGIIGIVEITVGLIIELIIIFGDKKND